MSFCFYFCVCMCVHIAKKEGLIEYQHSGFPVNSSSKRRRISSQNSPDDHLSSAKGKVAPVQVANNHTCAVGSSADLPEVSMLSTQRQTSGFLHKQFEDCQGPR